VLAMTEKTAQAIYKRMGELQTDLVSLKTILVGSEDAPEIGLHNRVIKLEKKLEEAVKVFTTYINKFRGALILAGFIVSLIIGKDTILGFFK